MKYQSRLVYLLVGTIAAVKKSKAKEDNRSTLALPGPKYRRRSHYLNAETETGEKEKDRNRVLEVTATKLFKTASKALQKGEPTKFVASDGAKWDNFGASCSISGDFVVIGSTKVGHDNVGAAYLFNINGNEIKKLTPGDDGDDDDYFGWTLSMDEKIVIGTWRGNYVQVFSLEGNYERTITCDDCSSYEFGLGNGFGGSVATHGDRIVTSAFYLTTFKLFIYTTEGELLKELETGPIYDVAISDIAISDKFIVTSARGSKTVLYENSAPEFPIISEIEQGGNSIAIAGDKLVIGDYWENDFNGAAYLYNTAGKLIKTLDRQNSSERSAFGASVEITDEKVLISAPNDDCKNGSGSVFIYSADTGECIEKITAPDGKANDNFGDSVCASDSHYMVGAPGFGTPWWVDFVGNGCSSGAAYLYQFCLCEVDES